MNNTKTRGLEAVVELREREKDKLVGELATQRALTERYRNTLARLDALCAGAGASGAQGAANLAVLSLNCGDYKQSVMKMAAGQRDELGVQEAELRRAEQALVHAAHRHAAMSITLERQQQDIDRAASRREQKGQDELATQTWWGRQA
jgi:flagellar export protein FliJ